MPCAHRNHSKEAGRIDDKKIVSKLIALTILCISSLGFGVQVGKSDDGVSSARTVNIDLGETTHEQFFNRLELFAQENRFAYRRGETEPGGQNFLVQMWREDLKITVVNPFEVKSFVLNFFRVCEEEANEEVVSHLVASLRRTLGIGIEMEESEYLGSE